MLKRLTAIIIALLALGILPSVVAWSINFTSPTDGLFVNRSYILVNVTTDAINITNITIELYDSGEVLNYTNSTNQPDQNGSYAEFTDLSDGLYYINATATDNDSIANFSERINVTVDTAYPEISFNVDTDNITLTNKGYIIINVTANDTNLENITIYIYNSSGEVESVTTINATAQTDTNYINYTTIEDGLYFFNATTYDKAGNWNITETRNITIDRTPPSLEILSPNSTTYTNDTVLINISSDGDNVWFYNGTGNQTYNESLYLTFSEGAHTIYAYANDSLGNMNSTNITFTITLNVAPTVSMNSLSNDSNSSQRNVTLNATAYDDDLDNMTLSVYGDGILLYIYYNQTNGTTITYNWTNLTNGVHNWTVIANDGELNSTSVYYYFTIINHIPTITLNLPLNNSNSTRNSTLLNVTVYDQNLDDLTVWFYGDSVLINTTYGQVNGTIVTYNWTSLSDGAHNWTVVVSDGTTNSTNAYYYFTVDTSPPAISIISPQATTYATATILVNISSNGTNTWFYNGTGNQTYNESLYLTFSEGAHTIYAYANDSLGNINSTSVTFTVDTTPEVETPPRSSGGSSSSTSVPYVPPPVTVTSNDTDKIVFTEYISRNFNGSRLININKQGMPIIYLSLKIINPSNNSNTLDVISQSNNPSTQTIDAKTYRFVTFSTSLDEKQIDKIEIKFKLSKSWMGLNNLTAENITLSILDENWTKVNLSKYSEDTGYLYYSSEISELKSLAIGGPIIPNITKPLRITINRTEDENKNQTTNVDDTSTTEDNATISEEESKGFLKNSVDGISNFLKSASKGISEYISDLAATKDKRSVAVLVISTSLTIILAIVTAILVYKNTLKSKRSPPRYSHKKIQATRMSYIEEPPTRETIVATSATSAQEKVPEEPPLPNTDNYVKKINQLLTQCEYALDNGKPADAKKYYEEARNIYFKTNLDYEHKAKVYNRIIELYGKVNR